MIRVAVSNVPSGKRGIIRLAERAAAKEADLDFPPRVVETFPANQAKDVDCTLREIKVTFDRPMMGGQQWSWIIHTDLGVTRATRARPSRGGRGRQDMVVLAVRLSPDTLYAVGVNSFRHTGFRDPCGQDRRALRRGLQDVEKGQAASFLGGVPHDLERADGTRRCPGRP